MEKYLPTSEYCSSFRGQYADGGKYFSYRPIKTVSIWFITQLCFSFAFLSEKEVPKRKHTFECDRYCVMQPRSQGTLFCDLRLKNNIFSKAQIIRQHSWERGRV